MRSDAAETVFGVARTNGPGGGAATGAASHHAALADVLVEVSLAASRSGSLDEMLQDIVDCVVRRLPIAIACIFLVNTRRTHFVQTVHAGSLDLDLPSNWPVRRGVAGRCVREGRAQLVTDVATDADYITGNTAVCAEYVVPIRHRDSLLGVLSLQSTKHGFFDAEGCRVFDAVALQIAGIIHLARVVQELEQTNRQLEKMSLRDGLTGIANRLCFERVLHLTWKDHDATGRSVALLMVDVDHFKGLNDAHGHLYGDKCLRHIARQCMLVARRREDLAARYGGEEFALLLANCGPAEAVRAAEQLRSAVETLAIPHPASSVAPGVTVSVGVATSLPYAALPPEALVECADRALYRAKHEGRNRVALAGG